MKKLFGLLLLSLFVFSFTSAITFEKEDIVHTIVPQYNQPAEIELTISDAPEGQYNIYTLTDVNLFPTEHFYLSNGENKLDVKIFPLASLNARGFYTFVYYLRDSQGENHKDKITVKVVDLRDLVEISSEANYPGDEMKFFVKNKENAKLNNLSVTFSSIFFETEEAFDLEPFEKIIFTVSVDQEKIKKIPAGSYLLEAKFNTEEESETIKGKIYFGESKEITTEEKTEGFFVRTKSIMKINKGNTIETIKIVISKNILTSSFTFFSERPDGLERKGLINNYYWIRQINPSESVEISARTNYLVLLIIFVIILGTIIAFRRYNFTKLEIIKSVSHVKTKGGEFALRVTIRVKAHKDVENVSINERIPAIVKVHETFGVIKPSSINLKDRKLQWNLGNLQAGEDRLFSYVIYSKVGVVGKFSLPASIAVFEENGNLSETFSNKVFFLSEQVKRLE